MSYHRDLDEAEQSDPGGSLGRTAAIRLRADYRALLQVTR
jgi:hypothetical protein